MKTRAVLLVATVLLIERSAAQGCSDAGVCTAGPIGELAEDSSSTGASRHFARLTFSYAVGEQSTVITQVTPELNLGITDRLSVQLKVPYISATGNLGDNSGIGDPTITTSYAFIKQPNRRLDGTLGVKLNANEADASTVEGQPLPMPYQTSLGTTDLLAGVNYRFGRFQVALAYQHVLANKNKNGFTHDNWPDNEDAEGYFESWELDRADDAVVRVQYGFQLGKLTVQPGALAIFHMDMDSRLAIPQPTVWSNDTSAYRFDIAGSGGLTLNLTADARYVLSDTWSLEASYGSPMITREVRPDGLTRSMVLNVRVRLAF